MLRANQHFCKYHNLILRARLSLSGQLQQNIQLKLMSAQDGTLKQEEAVWVLSSEITMAMLYCQNGSTSHIAQVLKRLKF
jgi:hypothetical protein